MILKRSKATRKAREDLILPRLVKGLKNRKVEIILNNGTRIEGYVKSYGKKVRTLGLASGIRQLHQANQRFGDLHTFLGGAGAGLRGTGSIGDAVNGCRGATGEGRSASLDLREMLAAYSWDGIREEVVSDYRSFVLLGDSNVQIQGVGYTFSDLSLRESNIAILTVPSENAHRSADSQLRATFPDARGEWAEGEGTWKDARVRKSMEDILRRIVNDHGNEMKNRAFLRCSRIGSNNTRSNLVE